MLVVLRFHVYFEWIFSVNGQVNNLGVFLTF